MIAMTLAEIPPKGTSPPRYVASAEWNDLPYVAISQSEPSCKLARMLVAAGAPDGPWEATQDGTVVWRGRSLHRWAGLTVSEPDRGPATFVKFVPFGGWDPPPKSSPKTPVQTPPAASGEAAGAGGRENASGRPGAPPRTGKRESVV
jgi:hypothetical protein